jgi:exosortase C (VPDSG-CTERM-specific)
MMKESHPADGDLNKRPPEDIPHKPDSIAESAIGSPSNRARQTFFLGFIALLVLLFFKPLLALAVHALHSELHSYVVLIPFISGFLVHLQRRRLPQEAGSSPGWGTVFLLAGLTALGTAWGQDGARFSHNDYLSLMAFSVVCLVLAGGFVFLGRKWMAAVAFPAAFLFFTVPLPDTVVFHLETASKLASADAADLLFQLTGTPALRDGTFFQLPGIVIEVAQECSGIRSSLVLLITGMLASYLLLRSPWRRVVLIAAVIPLGIVRNGLRILSISLLCVHIGPEMIHSVFHRRGGPCFFALSLIPLFLLLWWLRRGEIASQSANPEAHPGTK